MGFAHGASIHLHAAWGTYRRAVRSPIRYTSFWNRALCSGSNILQSLAVRDFCSMGMKLDGSSGGFMLSRDSASEALLEVALLMMQAARTPCGSGVGALTTRSQRDGGARAAEPLLL